MRLTFVSASLFLCLALLFSSCEPKQEYIIPEDDMINILVDIHLADGVLNTESFSYDDMQLRPENYYKNIFDKYSTNRLLFDSALSQYTKDRENYIVMYETVIEKLRTKEGYVQAKTDADTDIKTENTSMFYYSFFTDYESKVGLAKSIKKNLSREHANSGKMSYKVDGDKYPQAYSNILSKPIQEAEFEVSCFVKFDDVLEIYPTIAFLLLKDGKIISKQYTKIDKFVNKETTWKQIKVKAKLSLDVPQSDVKVATYFFNKKKASFYIDDYSIKIKQTK